MILENKVKILFIGLLTTFSPFLLSNKANAQEIAKKFSIPSIYSLSEELILSEQTRKYPIITLPPNKEKTNPFLNIPIIGSLYGTRIYDLYNEYLEAREEIEKFGNYTIPVGEINRRKIYVSFYIDKNQAFSSDNDKPILKTELSYKF